METESFMGPVVPITFTLVALWNGWKRGMITVLSVENLCYHHKI